MTNKWHFGEWNYFVELCRKYTEKLINFFENDNFKQKFFRSNIYNLNKIKIDLVY